MNIIFVSNTCDSDEYEAIFNQRKKKMIDPMQKFMEQLITGASESVENVSSVSIRPVSYSTVEQTIFKKKEKRIKNIHYTYPPFINGKFLRFLTQFCSVFQEILRITSQKSINRNNTVIICDALCFHASMAARLAAKTKRIKAVAIVTDIPSMATKMKSAYTGFRKYGQVLYERLTMWDIKKYDGYINLVKEMDNLINPNKRPSVVVEGTVEVLDEVFDVSGSDKKIVMYAGGINKNYGLECLVKSFILCNRSDAELHIYGDGAYVDELKELCTTNPNVKYMGVLLNSQMVKIESQATLLVNPRFSHEEYTFYSFPSKTLEYMSSGTPVCSTRLRGIPDDYNDFLYWFEDESIEGMANSLSAILDDSEENRSHIGNCAKQFVDEYKNKKAQGKKIVDFCTQLV